MRILFPCFSRFHSLRSMRRIENDFFAEEKVNPVFYCQYFYQIRFLCFTQFVVRGTKNQYGTFSHQPHGENREGQALGEKKEVVIRFLMKNQELCDFYFCQKIIEYPVH